MTIEFFPGNGDKWLELFIEECDGRESVSLRPIREVTPMRSRMTPQRSDCKFNISQQTFRLLPVSL